MFSYTADEMTGEPIVRLISKDYRNRFEAD
jgi:hypothetical protein